MAKRMTKHRIITNQLFQFTGAKGQSDTSMNLLNCECTKIFISDDKYN